MSAFPCMKLHEFWSVPHIFFDEPEVGSEGMGEPSVAGDRGR